MVVKRFEKFLGCFFQCAHCRFPANHLSSWPLCQDCHQALILCPPLCSVCGTPACLTSVSNHCLYPWRKKPWIHSYSGAYLLTPTSRLILRRWQQQNGWLLNQLILKQPALLWGTWKDFQPNQVIILAQPARFKSENFFHWPTQNHPLTSTERFAHWLRRQLKLPYYPIISRSKLQSNGTLLGYDTWVFATNRTFISCKVLLIDLLVEKKVYESLTHHLQQIHHLTGGKTEHIHLFRMGVPSPPEARQA